MVLTLKPLLLRMEAVVTMAAVAVDITVAADMAAIGAVMEAATAGEIMGTGVMADGDMEIGITGAIIMDGVVTIGAILIITMEDITHIIIHTILTIIITITHTIIITQNLMTTITSTPAYNFILELKNVYRKREMN